MCREIKLKEETLVSMLRSYWLEKWISALLFVVVAVLLYLSFGHSFYFDKLFLLVLVGALSIVRENRDLFFTLLVLLVLRILGEVLFLLSDLAHVKWGYYAVAIVTIVKLRNDWLVSTVLLPILFLSLCAELYWLLIGYQAPDLHFYFLALATNCWLRHFLVFKSHLKFFSSLEMNNESLDYSLFKLVVPSNIVISALILEYLVRHLTNFNPIIIYDAYSYIMQSISAVFFYLIIDHTLKTKFKLSA